MSMVSLLVMLYFPPRSSALLVSIKIQSPSMKRSSSESVPSGFLISNLDLLNSKCLSSDFPGLSTISIILIFDRSMSSPPLWTTSTISAVALTVSCRSVCGVCSGFTTPPSENTVIAIVEKAKTTIPIMSICPYTSETPRQSWQNALYFLPSTIKTPSKNLITNFLRCF
ncbi:hypothetical protein MSBR2_1886 [Methanosarcina barkeri 227]|uniref:Uncharacterized protein n=1 Tax=Methanosarcina barkeri 227 TaxID=1434106 RepID=A0A0E3R2A8_METBA|nr:hypothetical protein MSBR2_1886 [Methanosarcina barkeri 227]